MVEQYLKQKYREWDKKTAKKEEDKQNEVMCN